jgi:hypothetical protein
MPRDTQPIASRIDVGDKTTLRLGSNGKDMVESNTQRSEILTWRIGRLTLFIIAGLVISGATAIPLEQEVDVLVRLLPTSENPDAQPHSDLAAWILKVQSGLRETNAKYPFMAYGTDWLAFGHFVIAIAFFGALRDPVRNIWLFEFGMIASALVIPYALFFGAWRGIPFYWRLIDCSFGVLCFIPLWLCRRYADELAGIRGAADGQTRDA